MHVQAEYIIAVVVALAGAITFLFRKLLQANESRLRDARENRAMFLEFRRLIEKKRRESNTGHLDKERKDENGNGDRPA